MTAASGFPPRLTGAELLGPVVKSCGLLKLSLAVIAGDWATSSPVASIGPSCACVNFLYACNAGHSGVEIVEKAK